MKSLTIYPSDPKVVSVNIGIAGILFNGDIRVSDLVCGQVSEGQTISVRETSRDNWKKVKVALIEDNVLYCC